MDNFFKQFQDNLENRPEPPFEEKDWLTLEKRLEPQPAKYPLIYPLGSMWLLWMLALLLLMSLAANGYFYSKIKNNDNLMATMNSRIETTNSKTVVLQTDTIYKIQTIIERDTIYKTRVLRETVVSYLPPTFEGFQKNNLINTETNSSFNTTEKGTAEPLKNNTISLNSKDNLTGKTLNFNELEKIKTIPLSFLKIKKPTAPLDLGNLPIIHEEHKTLGQRLAFLHPKSYSIGASTGVLFPFGDGLSHPSGFSAGINGAMFFSPNVSMWVDVNYLQASYNVDKMGDAIGVPYKPTPDRSFIFNKAIVKEPTVQYMGGLRYRFDSPKHWQPYIGLGFGAASLLPYEVGYEFKNNSLGVVSDFDLKVKRSGIQKGFMLFDAGFERRISQHYRWQFGINYRINLLPSDSRYRLLGIKSGVSFDF